MGETKNEIPCIPEAGDHQAGRAIPSASEEDTGYVGHCPYTFYRWYDLYQRFGEAALEDRKPGPHRAWNRVPETIQQQIIDIVSFV